MVLRHIAAALCTALEVTLSFLHHRALSWESIGGNKPVPHTRPRTTGLTALGCHKHHTQTQNLSPSKSRAHLRTASECINRQPRRDRQRTTPQGDSSFGGTQGSKGALEALSDSHLRKVYGNFSVDIMKGKGCLGVVLSDCSTRTPIKVVNYNGAGLGFEASMTKPEQPSNHHRRHPWDTFVPAQNNLKRSQSDSTRDMVDDVKTQRHRSSNWRSSKLSELQQQWRHGRQA